MTFPTTTAIAMPGPSARNSEGWLGLRDADSCARDMCGVRPLLTQGRFGILDSRFWVFGLVIYDVVIQTPRSKIRKLRRPTYLGRPCSLCRLSRLLRREAAVCPGSRSASPGSCRWRDREPRPGRDCRA